MARRTLVLGDLHGAYRALLQVLERAQFEPKKDRLILLGDLADGWPEPVACLDLILTFPKVIAIRGNHDVWVQAFLSEGASTEEWLRFGGLETMEDYVRAGKLDDAAHRRFYEQMLPYYVDKKNRLYVHAGYDPRSLIQYQDPRDLRESRKLWNELLNSPSPEEEFPHDINAFKHVFIGHSQIPKRFPHHLPVNIHKVWNLDTGTKSTGCLTIMDAKTKEFWQSDVVAELYSEV